MVAVNSLRCGMTGFTYCVIPVRVRFMTQPIIMPLWAFILLVLFATVTLASHFLFPSVRWFFRKRAERLVARLNKRLTRPIEPFKLARRYDMIQRLIYDPAITEAVVEYAEEFDVPENVAFETAQRYAREIVPSFSATLYFTVGMRLAKWISRSMYRIRLGAFDREALESVDKDATVVFVMNHRSNMDYVLVTYLVSRAGALSYAVGEWARIWPLSGLIKMLGAYFIRRRSRGQLYRKVLARYVQMATDGGVTQAMFPEGGLSLTGAVGKPKLGLLNYIVTGNDPEKRDVVFVPVGLNYDRVLEDRFLVNADKTGIRKFRPPVMTMVNGVFRYLWLRLSRQMRGFGTASVGFGKPLSLREFRAVHSSGELTEAVAEEIMERIRGVVPVLSAPLVASVVLEQDKQSAESITASVAQKLDALKSQSMPRPRRDASELVTDILTRFERRELIVRSDGRVTATEEGRAVLDYYANTIDHHFQ